MGKMTVYHGSYTTVEKPAIIKSKNTKDFGTGFFNFHSAAALKCLEFVSAKEVAKW